MQILSVDEVGGGIKAIRPQSIMDMMKVGLLTTHWHCSGVARAFVEFCWLPTYTPPVAWLPNLEHFQTRAFTIISRRVGPASEGCCGATGNSRRA